MIALQIIITGIAATLAMTFFMNICAMFTHSNMYTVRILSQMLPAFFGLHANKGSKTSKIVAFGIHYGIGVLFALLYYLLRRSEGYIGAENSIEAWVVGLLYGIIGVSGWTVFVRLHPSPLMTVPWSPYLICIFAGHIIFAFVMILTYDWFSGFRM